MCWSKRSLFVSTLFLIAGCTLAVDGRLLGAECSTDEECDDGDVCNGVERCDVSGRVCVSGTALTCVDDEPCTADTCDAFDGCHFVFIDADGDGFSPETCLATGEYAGQGGDCNDTNSSQYPGAPEQCNGMDNDCDDDSDETPVSFPCYRDRDGDGYPSTRPEDVMMGCACDEGFIPGRADGLVDCANGFGDGTEDTQSYTLFALVHPNGVASAVPFCVQGDQIYEANSGEDVSGYGCSAGMAISWDYDCNGANERTYEDIALGLCTVSCANEGWVGGVAACGIEARYQTCRPHNILPGQCLDSARDRTQTCR